MIQTTPVYNLNAKPVLPSREGWQRWRYAIPPGARYSGVRGLEIMGIGQVPVGIGQLPEQVAGAGASTAAVAISQGVAAGTITAATAAIAIPIVGGVAAAAIIIMAWARRRGAQKVAATHVVDEAEPFLAANRDSFLASVTSGRATQQEQATALNNFDTVWSQVVQECRAIGGGGGERCIIDREPGGQWDWFAIYRVPIAQAQVSRAGSGSSFGFTIDPATGQAVLSPSWDQSLGGIPPGLLLAGGLLVLALFMGGGGGRK